MTIGGRAVVIRRDNVDTDVLYPGPYLNIDDPEKMKPYLFEGLDPSLRDQLDGSTVLMVGANFGAGSSREHVPLAMLAWGIAAVVGVSFARIFYRNCINLGLPILICPEAVAAAHPGVAVEIELEQGEVQLAGERFNAAALPRFMIEMLETGGLVPWVQHRLAR